MFLKDVIGQEEIKNKLIKSVTKKMIPHAQLFLGDSELGSLPLAIAFSRYLFCESKQEKDSCGRCSNCLQITAFTHPDLHFIYPVTNMFLKKKATSSNFSKEWKIFLEENPYGRLFDWMQKITTGNKQLQIGVDESNQLIKKLHFTSFKGGYRVAIIWRLDKINKIASNKLLKIIEEPPEKTLFIFIAKDDLQLMKTLLSRTQIIKLKRNKPKITANIIKNKIGAEKQKVVEFPKINLEKEFYRYFIEWMRLCFRLKVEHLLLWVEKIANIGREQQKKFFLFSLEQFRESLLINYQIQELASSDQKNDEFDLNKFAPFIHQNNIIKIYQALNKAGADIERNANPKILLLDLSLHLNKLLNTKM